MRKTFFLVFVAIPKKVGLCELVKKIFCFCIHNDVQLISQAIMAIISLKMFKINTIATGTSYVLVIDILCTRYR